MSDISPCVGCGASVDCDQPDQYAYSLTADPTLPFVLNCPAGFNCNQALTLKLNCCHHILSANKAANATNPQVSTILRALLIQCAQFNNQCEGTLPINNIVQNTVFSAVGSCTIFCPDGTPFTFTTPQTLYLGLTQQEANLFAHQDACRLAPQHLICIGTLPTTLPFGVAFSQKLLATGFLAAFPQQNLWDINGDIPTGMTFTDGFFSTGEGPTLTGTPTLSGPFTFSVKVINPNGDSQTKSFTITIGPAPANIAYFAFEQSVTPWLDSNSAATLPFSSWNSAAGLIGLSAKYTGVGATTSTGTVYPVTVPSSGGVTWWFWFNSTTAATNGAANFVWSDGTHTLRMVMFSLPASAGTVEIFTPSTSNFTPVSYVRGAWCLLALTWEKSTGTLRTYFNGALINTVSSTTTLFPNGSYSFRLESTTDSTDCFVDEAGVCWTTAASGSQVTSIYNGGSGVTWPAIAAIFP